jgi:hypothetical protein
MESNPVVFKKKIPEIKLSDYSPDKILNNVFIEKKNMLTSSILLNIEEHSKLYFNIFLISFIVIAHIVLLTKRYTIDEKDKKYIKFYNDLYYDLLKYSIIEIALVAGETIQNNKINITTSLARVSIVLISLIIFHSIKGNFGLE